MSLLFPGYSKVCDGEGCTTQIPMCDSLCGACAIHAANEESDRRVYAEVGLRELECYLQRWAEFEAQYGPN